MGILAVTITAAVGAACYGALACMRMSPATDAATRVDLFWSGRAIVLHAMAAALLLTVTGAWLGGMASIETLLADGARMRDRRIVLIAWFAAAFYATAALHAVARRVTASTVSE